MIPEHRIPYDGLDQTEDDINDVDYFPSVYQRRLAKNLAKTSKQLKRMANFIQVPESDTK